MNENRHRPVPPKKAPDDELEDFRRLGALAMNDAWDDGADAIYDNWREIYGVEEG